MSRDDPALIEGGHYTLAGRPLDAVEPIVLPDGRAYGAATTGSTRVCFAEAVREVVARRAAGGVADVGLLVGDLDVPGGTRPIAGAWALPPSYREILSAAGLAPADVVVWGEAYARNQGKRRLLDAALDRAVCPRLTYSASGWALMSHPDGGIHLASDASLDWGGEQRAAVLTRGTAALCPLVFAGLSRAIGQAGYRRHVAIYALADDGWIDVKLQAGATAAAQLASGDVPEPVHRLYFADGRATVRAFDPSELVAPGERSWDGFLNAVGRASPDLRPLDAEERTWRRTRSGRAACGSGGSRCSG
jgi:hypothetical protein